MKKAKTLTEKTMNRCGERLSSHSRYYIYKGTEVYKKFEHSKYWIRADNDVPIPEDFYKKDPQGNNASFHGYIRVENKKTWNRVLKKYNKQKREKHISRLLLGKSDSNNRYEMMDID